MCPLCGRFVSLAYFDPTGFDLDVYCVDVTGLGRGKGVKVTGKYSVLNPGDVAIELIKDRILELTEVLLDHGCLNPQEALSRLKIETTDPTEVVNLRNRAKSLEVKLEATERERNQLHSECERLEAVLNKSRTEFNKLRGEVEVLEADLEEVRGERDKLKSEKESLETEIKELEEAQNSYDAEIYDLTEMVDKVEGEGWKVDEEDDPLESLKARIIYVLNEYESLVAESEWHE